MTAPHSWPVLLVTIPNPTGRSWARARFLGGDALQYLGGQGQDGGRGFILRVPGLGSQVPRPAAEFGRVVGRKAFRFGLRARLSAVHGERTSIMADSLPGSGAPGDSDSRGDSEGPATGPGAGLRFVGPPDDRLYIQGSCRDCGIAMFSTKDEPRAYCSADGTACQKRGTTGTEGAP